MSAGQRNKNFIQYSRWRSGDEAVAVCLSCLFEQVSPFIILNITICSEKQDERTKTNKQEKLLRNDGTSIEILSRH